MNAARVVRSAESNEVIFTVEPRVISEFVVLTTGSEFTGLPAQTIYLDPIEARQLANALLSAVLDVVAP